jgi:hypothetical protein
LHGIRDNAPQERRTGRRKIPNEGNGLSRVGRNQAGRTLTGPASLAANWWQSGLRKFSLRQSRDRDVAARDPEKNAAAKHFPQICHAAVRFGWRSLRLSEQESCQAWIVERSAAIEFGILRYV